MICMSKLAQAHYSYLGCEVGVGVDFPQEFNLLYGFPVEMEI